MTRIGILTCSNATQDLGCSSASCLADFRKKRGYFKEYEDDIQLVGIISCAGCPTLTGSDKLLKRIRGLTEFRIDAIHFSNCIKNLCPFRKKYFLDIQKEFPNISIVIGTHTEHISDHEFKTRVKGLFSQENKTMIDMILGKD
ncbi:MAG: CGGC domain-containing protein [Patescibacteria group bacterium]|jgi:predicted metal-binding protein|nr:CGGC domain-containing protein [Patescibacteria group bacterium]